MEQRLLNSTGKRIRVLREDLGLKQGELVHLVAEAGGDIGKSAMSKIERDHRAPTTEQLVTLAHALDTTTDYLLLLTDDPLRTEDSSEAGVRQVVMAEEPAPHARAAEDAGELLSLFSRLSPGRQRDLLDLAEMWLADESEDYEMAWFASRLEGNEAAARELRRLIDEELGRLGEGE